MDAHPDYLSTKFASRFAEKARCPALPIQHHFAHVLSCMAENETTGPALGIAWDGTGYGPDSTIWGGEFLKVSDSPTFDRFAHFRTFPLPGGDTAVKEPRRSALGLLYELYGDPAFDLDLPSLRAFSPAELTPLRSMLRRSLNSPRTSSAGRLFDAVSSIAGLRQRSSFEGQSAMHLEFSAAESGAGPEATLDATLDAAPTPYPFTFTPPIVDWSPVIRAIIAHLHSGAPPALISARFHLTLAAIILAVARAAAVPHVVLTGGCFQNERLLSLAVHSLRDAGFHPLWHQRVPPNDGGIALGQVAAAWRTFPGNTAIQAS